MKTAFREWLQKKVDHEKAQNKFMEVYEQYKDDLERQLDSSSDNESEMSEMAKEQNMQDKFNSSHYQEKMNQISMKNQGVKLKDNIAKVLLGVSEGQKR